jgi:hypothetical protein
LTHCVNITLNVTCNKLILECENTQLNKKHCDSTVAKFKGNRHYFSKTNFSAKVEKRHRGTVTHQRVFTIRKC